MNALRYCGRSLLVLVFLANLALAQNVSGTAAFSGGSYQVEFELVDAGDPSETTGTGEIVPPPGTQKLTVRWDKVTYEGVEWIVFSRDEAILGAVKLPANTPGNAWLNDGSNNGAGQYGTWQ